MTAPSGHSPPRGHLRVYLGAAPGVGKTYAMLNEGRRRHDRGTDVVVAVAETYGRPLTAEALAGLEVVPPRTIVYHGASLAEMDLDGVLARHPEVALVDELAHTNVPGSRNEKRWQDVEELLAAGIAVVSTLNVQHLESLNDVVAGITGIRVRETVPDAVIDAADEVEVVDISPRALRARMRHGNIYPPRQAEQALGGFFREGNLAALRELVLQRVTQEAEQQLTAYMRDHEIEGWEAAERCLVLLDATPAAEVALRRAWRLAHGLNGDLIAAYPAPLLRGAGMTRLLTVAMDLNAKTVELPGDDLADELSRLVAAESITHVTLVAGGRALGGWRRTTLAEHLLARHPSLDIHLVGQPRDPRPHLGAGDGR